MGLPATPRRSPVAYFMVGALALVAVAASCGGGETSSTAGGSAVVASTTSTASTGATGAVAATATPAPRGQVNYVTHCASCHGVSGEGQPNWLIPGPDGTLLAPPHDNTGHTWHHGDGYLFAVTKRGGSPFKMPGQPSGMPGFDAQMTDGEIVEVIQYIKGFWGGDEREFQASVSRGDPFP